MKKPEIRTNSVLQGVRYEIRGELAARAIQLERQGYEIISLNMAAGLFGYRTPETMRLAMIENLFQAEATVTRRHTAREAVVMQQQNRGILDVTADDVLIGNGVSECIELAMRALLKLVRYSSTARYPLWTASVSPITASRSSPAAKPLPDPENRPAGYATRAIVIISEQSTGAVYDRAALAPCPPGERHGMVVFSDEIMTDIVRGCAARAWPW
jgi:alanine-synthesizing transaminase